MTAYKRVLVSSDARRAYEKHMRKCGRFIGAPVDALFNKGGVELMQWLTEITPEGVTVSETLAAIAMDAMHEENEL